MLAKRKMLAASCAEGCKHGAEDALAYLAGRRAAGRRGAVRPGVVFSGGGAGGSPRGLPVNVHA